MDLDTPRLRLNSPLGISISYTSLLSSALYLALRLIIPLFRCGVLLGGGYLSIYQAYYPSIYLAAGVLEGYAIAIQAWLPVSQGLRCGFPPFYLLFGLVETTGHEKASTS